MKTIEFSKLKKVLDKKAASWKDILAPAFGSVEVVTISRDGCGGCRLQKPVLEKLARRLAAKYEKRIGFSTIHINWKPGFQKESLMSKKILGHYFYPCTVILIKTKDMGPVEYFRCGYPSAAELHKYTIRALHAAEALK